MADPVVDGMLETTLALKAECLRIRTKFSSTTTASDSSCLWRGYGYCGLL